MGSASTRRSTWPGRRPAERSPRCELGRVLALDPGSRRVGVAVSDPLRIVSSPLEVVEASRALDRVRELVEEYRPDVIVVGLPVGLAGAEGPSAEEARRFGHAVGEATGVEVVFVDERFTTRTADAAMLEGGVRRRERRRNVDKVAAAVILQHYLAGRADGPDSP